MVAWKGRGGGGEGGEDGRRGREKTSPSAILSTTHSQRLDSYRINRNKHHI